MSKQCFSRLFPLRIEPANHRGQRSHRVQGKQTSHRERDGGERERVGREREREKRQRGDEREIGGRRGRGGERGRHGGGEMDNPNPS